ncbi:MAG: PIN domain-containing protein [Desulfobacterales bacterium]|nr:PIN domain-containing protein [Desulfobacterales bacterium]
MRASGKYVWEIDRTLVPCQAWIDYFRGGDDSEHLDFLIDENLLVTNDLILTELIPFLKVRNESRIINLLYNINKLDLFINWSQIVDFQYKCLKNGLNGVGIPDLLIAQNAKQNTCEIYTLDNHFFLMKDILSLQIET